jgi:hypothetical protein
MQCPACQANVAFAAMVFTSATCILKLHNPGFHFMIWFIDI